LKLATLGVLAADRDTALDEGPVPKYPVPGTELFMRLRRFRLRALLAPTLIIIILEGIRMVVSRNALTPGRIVVDAVVAVTFTFMGLVMVRAIANAHLRLERQNEELLALHGASVDITAELSLHVVLNKVVDRARELLGARYGALSVVDAEGRIESFITSGITPEQRAILGAPPTGHGLLGVVLHHGERLRTSDLTKDPRSVGFPPNHPMMRSLLAVPVVCKSPFAGNLYLAEKEGDFNLDDEQTLQRFAVQAAVAIDNAYLHEQVGTLAVAQERLRIAHEMHDGIAQVLGYVNTKVQAAIEYMRRDNDEEAKVQLQELGAAAREAYSDVREAIVDLRTLPGPHRQFTDVVREYVERWHGQTGIPVELNLDENLVIPPAAELQLIRIIQESLANVRKHSRASKATIELRRRDGTVRLEVTDDGSGFNQEERVRSEFPRFGLSTMRERAESIGAIFAITTAPGQGTRVNVSVPVTSA
jgi:signal transduction histidine kinase